MQLDLEPSTLERNLFADLSDQELDESFSRVLDGQRPPADEPLPPAFAALHPPERLHARAISTQIEQMAKATLLDLSPLERGEEAFGPEEWTVRSLPEALPLLEMPMPAGPAHPGRPGGIVSRLALCLGSGAMGGAMVAVCSMALSPRAVHAPPPMVLELPSAQPAPPMPVVIARPVVAAAAPKAPVRTKAAVAHPAPVAPALAVVVAEPPPEESLPPEPTTQAARRVSEEFEEEFDAQPAGQATEEAQEQP